MSEAAGFQADLRVAGAVAADDRRTLGQRLERLGQEGGIALVKRGQRIDGLDGIVEALRFERLGRDEG